MSDSDTNEYDLTTEQGLWNTINRQFDIINRQQEVIEKLAKLIDAPADGGQHRHITIGPSMPPITREMVNEILRAEGVLLYRPIVEDESPAPPKADDALPRKTHKDYVDEAVAHARAVAEYIHSGSDDMRRGWAINFVYNLLALDVEARSHYTIEDIKDFGSPTPTGKKFLTQLVGEAIMQGAPIGYPGR